MNSEIQLRLLRAVHACMRPIARILLRSGITYRQFADVAKLAFVQEAFDESSRGGAKTNISRAAVQTGMSRKEIAKVEASLSFASLGREQYAMDHSGPPSRVLHEWHTNPAFLNSGGQPLLLSFDGAGRSFASLVRQVAGDIPAASIRNELVRAGAIAVAPNGEIEPRKRFYVPGDVDERALTVISQMLFPLAAGLAHNVDPRRTSHGFIQRVVVANELRLEAVPVFRQVTRRRAAEFIESVDDWLRKDDAFKSVSDSKNSGTVCLGVFYYEGPSIDEMMPTPNAANNDKC